eukprot:9621856-Alexandrium_andersonii.AAC.1
MFSGHASNPSNAVLRVVVPRSCLARSAPSAPRQSNRSTTAAQAPTTSTSPESESLVSPAASRLPKSTMLA